MSSKNFSLLSLAVLLSLSWTGLRADDEATIRKAVDSYVEAFNRGDASAVAALWHDQGEWISPAGDRIKGREAIHAELESYFAEGGGHIEVSDTKIRFLAPTVAVEEGRARVTRRGELPNDTTYIAIHVKDGDNWKLESVRETEVPPPPSNFDKLKDLDWMVGTWVDQDENGTIQTTCQWTKNRNFLTRSFNVSVEGKVELEGTQVIGYDSAKDRIRSWVFDSRPFDQNWYSRNRSGVAQPWSPWSNPRYGQNHWWGACSAGAMNTWFPNTWSQPNYYSYGSGGSVYYENNAVYVGGQEYASADQYYEQAVTIAENVPQIDESQGQEMEWLPLGVFALTKEGVNESNMLLQLAVSKDGIVAGTLFNDSTDSSRPVEGSIDTNTQRAAWHFADGKNADVVMETGIYNLTEAESQALVHFGTDKVQEVVLVRLDEPDGSSK